MALSERQNRKVAEEKKRAALAGGRSREEAQRYHDEVIAYGKKMREQEAQKKKR